MSLKVKSKIEGIKAMDKADQRKWFKELLINNSLFIFIIIAVVFIQIQRPEFLGKESIVNIISLSAAAMPLALGIAGAIILTGTDLSAGRIVGLTACVAASLLQMSDYANKMFPNLPEIPVLVVFVGVVLMGAFIGGLNGTFIAKLNLHPFIVTLATQLMLYGIILMYLMNGNNNGQAISGLDEKYTNLIKGSLFSVGSTPVPNFVLFVIVLTIVMWVVWNKTEFGKNMFAVGANAEAANVSGVNVGRTIIKVFLLAGALYAVSGFIEAARIGSNSANTGFNYEMDGIAACVIGGVSFVGGIGKISGVIMGVVLLKLIFVGLSFLSVSVNMIYIIKGLIILVACAIDMRKYLVRK
ncbi:methyl-galactoside transport system permease protein [Aequitasia blattaphilus]|uniref:Beta-methylgalactoside transporter n=1 Tax=Aequitasia blattaphilus TaxID=2949332 RepID=A0ABT1ECV0_9FIRM|nr:beta-methylgalactoside transporter [Aequitasia blattaphilus]MCP1103655.1 beta-methylgalactoside transporter [Aequitasia blattaphilus]MCR8616295.1 beta-methylgalactoside transporter [Aequitasia blattaphilus]